jgi:hypothetical protein
MRALPRLHLRRTATPWRLEATREPLNVSLSNAFIKVALGYAINPADPTLSRGE